MEKVNVKINGKDRHIDESQTYENLINLAGKDLGCQVLYKAKIPCEHCGMRKAAVLREGQELTVTEGMTFNILRC